MIINSLSYFSEIKINELDINSISQIEMVLRDLENFESYNNVNSSIRYEELKLSPGMVDNFFLSHKLKLKILIVVYGELEIHGTTKSSCMPLDYEFHNAEYHYYDSNDYFQINNLKKSKIIIFESRDVYKLIAKQNYCKLFIVNIY
jgi:hypothetical protein